MPVRAVASTLCPGESQAQVKKPNRLSGDLVGRCPSDALKQTWQTHFQPFGDLFEVHQRDVAHSALYAGIVCSVQPAPFRRLFLIDRLFLADATNCTAKPNANVERHWFL